MAGTEKPPKLKQCKFALNMSTASVPAKDKCVCCRCAHTWVVAAVGPPHGHHPPGAHLALSVVRADFRGRTLPPQRVCGALGIRPPGRFTIPIDCIDLRVHVSGSGIYPNVD